METQKFSLVKNSEKKTPRFSKPPLTRNDVKEMFGVTYNTIKNWEKDKNDPIPHFRRGNVVRFDEDEVVAWREKNKKGGDSE